RRCGELEKSLIADRSANRRLDGAGAVAALGAWQHQRGKFGRGALVAGRAGVRDIIGDRAEPVRMRIHARYAGAHHSVKAHFDLSDVRDLPAAIIECTTCASLTASANLLSPNELVAEETLGIDRVFAKPLAQFLA